MQDEIPLTGGNTHDSVVRVGDTVRRPTGPWTPAVHALLRHLEKRGVNAPRVLGIDDRGREILTFVPGDVVWPDHAALMDDDDFLARVAKAIRVLHGAVADFVPPPGADWMQLGADPVHPSEIVCHNDLASWNLVVGAGGDLTFIDWDTSAPARRVWDLAWSLLSFIPLLPSERTDSEVIARLRVFIDAYGRDDFPPDALEVAIDRCRIEADRIEAEAGRLLREGHADTWRAGQHLVTAKRPIWSAAFD